MKWFYEVMYKRFRAPWEIGPREELVTLVEDGALPPCRAIDLGCGSGANAIYLAQHGFDVPTRAERLFSLWAVPRLRRQEMASSARVSQRSSPSRMRSRPSGNSSP